MAKSSRPDRKEFRDSNGRFIQGEYSPARRATAPSMTTVPPRASAYPSDVVKVRPRYPRAYSVTETLERDVTRIPTMPPAVAIWQYETPQYEAESSLSSLSLAISEATRLRSPAIDELDTSPPVPDTPSLEEKKRDSKHKYAPTLSSWIDRTEVKTTPEYVGPQEALDASVSSPFDRFRWWLLLPGRIELILWICGTLVLICVTGLLVFMLAVSSGFFHTQQNASTVICSSQESVQSAATGRENCTLSTVSSSSGLQITMLNGDLMETGRVLRLRGQGFHRLGRITITHDANVPCQPNIIQADEQGEFAVVIKLDDKGYWGAGRHQIKINDTESKHSIILTVMLEPQK